MTVADAAPHPARGLQRCSSARDSVAPGRPGAAFLRSRALRSLRIALLGACALAGAGCPSSDDAFPSFGPDSELEVLEQELVPVSTRPGSPTNRYADNPAAAALGEALFHDTGFSRSVVTGGTCRIACSSCHPAPTFANNLAFSYGCDPAHPTERNTPSLANAAHERWYYWDGRKDSLWSHASIPLLRSIEMNSTPEVIRERLVEQYAGAYQTVFGTAPDAEPDALRLVANVGKAIEAYLRSDTFVSVKSCFDQARARFVEAARAVEAGDKSVRLEDDPAHLPLKTFVRTGRCTSCHVGGLLSDQRFHNLGISERPGVQDRGHALGADILQQDSLNGGGVYSDDRTSGARKLASLSANTERLGAFKTPSLRGVAGTAPYMHDGSLATLEEVIDFYDRGGDESGFLGERTETIARLGLQPAEKVALRQLLEALSRNTDCPF